MAKKKNRKNKQRKVQTQKGTVTAIAQGVKSGLVDEGVKKAEKSFIQKASGRASAPVTAPAVTTVKKDEEGEITVTSKEFSRAEKRAIVKTHKALEAHEEKHGETEKTLVQVGTMVTGDHRFTEKHVPVETQTVLNKRKHTMFSLTVRTMNHQQTNSGIWVTRPQDLTVPCFGRDVYNKLMKKVKKVVSDPKLRKDWQAQVKADIDTAASGKTVKRDIKIKGKVMYTYAIHDKLGELKTHADFQAY